MPLTFNKIDILLLPIHSSTLTQYLSSFDTTNTKVYGGRNNLDIHNYGGGVGKRLRPVKSEESLASTPASHGGSNRNSLVSYYLCGPYGAYSNILLQLF